MKFIVVELDDGVQELFESTYDAFRFAKAQESQRSHSVDYIAIGTFEEEGQTVIYGQELRKMLRSVDAVESWVRAGVD